MSFCRLRRNERYAVCDDDPPGGKSVLLWYRRPCLAAPLSHSPPGLPAVPAEKKGLQTRLFSPVYYPALEVMPCSAYPDKQTRAAFGPVAAATGIFYAQNLKNMEVCHNETQNRKKFCEDSCRCRPHADHVGPRRLCRWAGRTHPDGRWSAIPPLSPGARTAARSKRCMICLPRTTRQASPGQISSRTVTTITPMWTLVLQRLRWIGWLRSSTG